jgi:hypothetical protein
MKIEPFSGVNKPIRHFRNTDLPVPEGPSSTDTSPGGNVIVRSDQMLAGPNDFESPSTRTSTPVPIRASLAGQAPTPPPAPRLRPVTRRIVRNRRALVNRGPEIPNTVRAGTRSPVQSRPSLLAAYTAPARRLTSSLRIAGMAPELTGR